LREGEMAQSSAGGSSSGRRWAARVLLGLAVILIVVKATMVLQSLLSGSSIALSRQFESLIGVVSPLCLVAYFFVRPRTLSNENAVKLILAWGFVGIPLGWGVVETVINAAKLFQ